MAIIFEAVFLGCLGRLCSALDDATLTTIAGGGLDLSHKNAILVFWIFLVLWGRGEATMDPVGQDGPGWTWMDGRQDWAGWLRGDAVG